MTPGARTLRRREAIPSTLGIARERYAAGDLELAEALGIALARDGVEPIAALTLAGRAALRRNALDVVTGLADLLAPRRAAKGRAMPPRCAEPQPDAWGIWTPCRTRRAKLQSGDM